MNTATASTRTRAALDDPQVPPGHPDSGLDSPVIRRHRLGAELRRLREAASLRIEDVTGELGVAQSTLSRIETGQAPARTSYVNALLSIYGVTDAAERRRLSDLACDGRRKGWWAEYERILPAGTGSYLGLEAAASSIRTFAVQTVPDLLQTGDYAKAACQAARPASNRSTAASLADVTMRRKDALRDEHHLHAIIDESALSRVIGPVPAMRAQLRYLQELCADPSVTVQILSMSARNPVISAPLTLLSFPDPEDPDIACRHGADGQIVITKHPATTAAMRHTFRALATSALPPHESARLITTMATQR